VSFFRFLTIVFLLALGACAVSIPPVTPIQAEWAAQRWPGMDFEQLDFARTTYVNRCSGCHGLYLPTERTLSQWHTIMDKMAPKAKLTAQQRELVQRYLTTAHETAN
jgi:hypothetical protein